MDRRRILCFCWVVLIPLWTEVACTDVGDADFLDMSNQEWNVRIELEDLGSLQGLRTFGSDFFGGIPYAAPPVGKLRWAPPEEPASWKPHLLDATQFGPDCHQLSDPVLNPRADMKHMSEDCLYLNIYTPVGASSLEQKLPVMLWFHGGAFQQGSAKRPEYDGRLLAQENNVVVVTANYRLGPLGFLVSSDLGLLGNYGLMDQRAVMYWVKKHISSFGGDPDSVCLFGESAGAVMIGLHLLMDNPGLFHRAILQSNPMGYQFRSVVVADFLGDAIRRAVDCRDLACLRSEPVEEIMRAQASLMGIPRSVGDFFAWGPTLTEQRKMRFDTNDDDKPFISALQTPQEPPATKYSVNVTAPLKNLHLIPDEIPIIIGTNKHEGEMFVHSAFPITMSKAVYWMFVGALFKDSASRVLKHYRSYVLEVEAEAQEIAEKQVNEEEYRQYFMDHPEELNEARSMPRNENSTMPGNSNANVVTAETVEELVRTFNSGGDSTPIGNSSEASVPKWKEAFRSFLQRDDPETIAERKSIRKQKMEERARQKALKAAAKVVVDYRPVMSRIINDYLFRCSSWHYAHELSGNRVKKKKTNNVYVYRFSQPTHVPGYLECWGKSCHTAELPYVFRAMDVIRSNYSTLSDIAREEAPEAPRYPYTEMINERLDYWPDTLNTTEDALGDQPLPDSSSIAQASSFRDTNHTSFQSLLNHFFGDYFHRDADDAIASDMSKRWVAFARTGNPNYEGSKAEWIPWRYIASDSFRADNNSPLHPAMSTRNEFDYSANNPGVDDDLRHPPTNHNASGDSDETSWSDDKLDEMYRLKALEAMQMEVSEENEMITELRRTKNSKADPRNPFFSLRSLASRGISWAANDNGIAEQDSLPRDAIREVQRLAQEMGVIGTGLSMDPRHPQRQDPGTMPLDEDFFPQLLELMWPPEGRLVERDCTCDFWERIRYRY